MQTKTHSTQPEKKAGYLSVLTLAALWLGACTPTPSAPKEVVKAPHGSMDSASMDTAKTLTASSDKVTAPYDLQFIDTMIKHHQGAINMAKMIEPKAQHADLTTFARNIISSQQKEIEEMEQWRGQWYANQPAAMNMEMPGMMASMKGMNMAQLTSASGNALDAMFIDMMIPHHQGAVVMANEALQKAEHADLLRLAQEIITAQEAEIKTMQSWKSQWAM